MLRRLLLPLTGLIAALLLSTAQAGDLRAIPSLTSPVIDEAGLLSGADRTALEDELRRYLPTLQLQIWLIDTLGPESIEGLSIRATDIWKLGTAKEDRGALMLVALQDRQMRIEIGQGLEGDIPDALAGRIISQILVPRFRAQDFFGGLQEASRTLFERAGGNLAQLPPGRSFAEPRRNQPRSAKGSFLFFLFALIIIVLSGIGGGRGGRGGRGSSFATGLLLGALSGRDRSSWGGSGGGGGWSGGGGGFSGGGSSGSW